MKFEKRRDLKFVFECRYSNPNGDPDADNMPRQDPVTGLGYTSDVWFKRIVRDLVMSTPPDPKDGYDIFVQSGAVANRLLEEASVQGDMDPKKTFEFLCRKYCDVRWFGLIGTTGTTGKSESGDEDEEGGGAKKPKSRIKNALKGSPYGQIRGPIAVTYSQSICPIVPVRVSITRCMVTKEEDIKKERTMGGKWVIPYGVYVGTISVSVIEAAKTGFTQEDYDNFLFYVSHLFSNNKSSGRSGLNMRSLVEFTHEGKSDGDPREQALGCQPDWKLFDSIKVTLKDGVTEPASWDDIDFRNTFIPEAFPGVTMRTMI